MDNSIVSLKVYLYLFIYLQKKDQKTHLEILGFHINDFDTGAVTGDICAVRVSSAVVLEISGTDIDRVGPSFEPLSPPDDDGWRLRFSCTSVSSVVNCSVRWRWLSRVF